jgi:hypothetical protein
MPSHEVKISHCVMRTNRQQKNQNYSLRLKKLSDHIELVEKWNEKGRQKLKEQLFYLLCRRGEETDERRLKNI